MSAHAYIPLYVDDYDSHTSHLSLEEDGAYNRLLRLCWRTPGCSLPNDMAWIARKIRLSADDFERVARPVLDEFFRLHRGRLIQRRLKREYDAISRKKSARKLAGKMGGEAKARKTKKNIVSNANDMPRDTRAFPSPTPAVCSEDKSSGADAPNDIDGSSWRAAVKVLTEQGDLTDKAARSLFGKLLSENHLEARDLLPALTQAMVNQTRDPAAYLRRAASGIAKRRVGDPPKRVGFV